MSWALVFIALAASFFLFREIKSIKARQTAKELENSWPQFEELYISALQSGISIADAFSYAQEFEIKALDFPVKNLIAALDRGIALQEVLKNFKSELKLGFADLFVEIVSIAHATGGQNVIVALQDHVESVRFELTALGNSNARNGAILTVAKLGLLAPWILFAVLCVNEKNRLAYSSVGGGLLLIGGFTVSLFAYRLVVMAGNQKPLPRIFVGAR